MAAASGKSAQLTWASRRSSSSSMFESRALPGCPGGVPLPGSACARATTTCCRAGHPFPDVEGNAGCAFTGGPLPAAAHLLLAAWCALSSRLGEAWGLAAVLAPARPPVGLLSMWVACTEFSVLCCKTAGPALASRRVALEGLPGRGRLRGLRTSAATCPPAAQRRLELPLGGRGGRPASSLTLLGRASGSVGSTLAGDGPVRGRAGLTGRGGMAVLPGPRRSRHSLKWNWMMRAATSCSNWSGGGRDIFDRMSKSSAPHESLLVLPLGYVQIIGLVNKMPGLHDTRRFSIIILARHGVLRHLAVTRGPALSVASK